MRFPSPCLPISEPSTASTMLAHRRGSEKQIRRAEIHSGARWRLRLPQH
jgi:hypothetical protein